ncbi:MAG: ankyrin repeat domain-containing protein [Syntrophorhabdaceae bacterium]
MKTRNGFGILLSILLGLLLLPMAANADLKPPPDFPLLEAVKKGDLETVRLILKGTPSTFREAEVNRKGITGDLPLSIAAANGNSEMVMLLIEHGAIVDAGKESGERTPLINASARGKYQIVKLLIGKGADVNAKGGEVTGLLAAIAGRYSPLNNPEDMQRTVHVLLENSADVNVQDESWMKTGRTPLMYAVLQGDASLVQVLLSKGARLDLKNKDDETALDLAKKNGLEYIAQLLERPHRSAPAELFESATHPLFQAVKQGRISEVKALIAEGMDVNLRTSDGDTPLMFAADNNKLEIVRFLLRAGSDVNAKNGANNTALIYACTRGHIRVVEELLRAKADVNVKNISKVDALIYAVINKETGVVNSLLKAGARSNDTYDDGKTALMMTAEQGSNNIGALLVAHEADVNAMDKDGMTALMIASEKGNIDLVRMLLKSGADPNKKSKYGDTALDKAISINNVRIAGLLVINNRNLDRRRALGSAVSAGNLEIVKLLFTKDTDVNEPGFAEGTLLMLAADTNLPLVKFLISKGADVVMKDAQEETALMKAVKSHQKTNLQIARYLIAQGSNVNDINKKGETPLILAVKSLHQNMAKLLVQKGSRLSLKDKDGKSAWTYAFETGQWAMVDLLEKAGASRDYPGMKWDGYVSKQKEEFIKVVDSQKEWSELWQRAFDKPAPAIDFEKYAVACVFLGHKAPWLYSIGLGGPEPAGDKLVISYSLHDVMLRLSGPFRAGGQYAMKVYERKDGVAMILQERGSTSQTRRR